jgi:carbonic anhydrase
MNTVELTYRCEAQGTPGRTRPTDSEAARQRLNEGNRAFAALLRGPSNEAGLIRHVVPVDLRDLGLLAGEAARPHQHPFAAILGCSDARVPVELIFGEGPNDLFVIRVAGNGLGSEVLGSVKYAMHHLHGSLKLIVVLGHSGCGALTGAVDVFLNPSEYLRLATHHSLRGILDRLLAVVQACAQKLVATFGSGIVGSLGYRKALIEAATITNAALAAYSIQQELAIGDSAGIQAVYGIYLIKTREVWTPQMNNAAGAALSAPPRDPAGFLELSDAIVKSERIVSLVNSNE